MKGKPKEKIKDCKECKTPFERTSTGHVYCGKCAKKRAIKRRREYDRKRRQTQQRKDWQKNYNKNNEKKKIRDYSYHIYKEKMISIHKGCELCHSKENLELHHKVYDKKIESLQLLCKKCHIKEHKRR